MATMSTSHQMMRRLNLELILALIKSRISRKSLATTELLKMQSNNVISNGKPWVVQEQIHNKPNSNNSKPQIRKRKLHQISHLVALDPCSRNLNM